jgi:hypothetical protein
VSSTEKAPDVKPVTRFLRHECCNGCKTALFVAAICLSGCSIETALPDLDYQVSDRAAAADWPKLVELKAFDRILVPDRDLSPEDGVEPLQDRAEALRQRAEALDGPVMPADDRQRLIDASSGSL